MPRHRPRIAIHAATQPPRLAASALQVRLAYEAHHGRPMPPTLSYHDAASHLVAALGYDEAKRFILSQENRP